MSSNNVLPKCPCGDNCNVTYRRTDNNMPIHETAIVIGAAIAGFHQIMADMEQTCVRFKLINPFVLYFTDYIFKSKFRCYACELPMPWECRVFCSNCKSNDKHIDPNSGLDRKITNALSALLHSMWAVEDNYREKLLNSHHPSKHAKINKMIDDKIAGLNKTMMKLAADEHEQLMCLKYGNIKPKPKPTRKSAK